MTSTIRNLGTVSGQTKGPNFQPSENGGLQNEV